MTRCGDETSCACTVEAGPNTTVTGSGSPENPYIISATSEVVAGSTFLEAGPGVIVTGAGTEGDPFVVRAAKKSGDIVLIVGSPTTEVGVGDAQWYFVVPASLNGFNISAVHAATTTAASSATTTVQLARVRSGTPVDVLSTRATIDATEVTSYTAVVPSVVDTANDDLNTGDLLRVDVDVAGVGAAGLQVIVSYLEP